MTLLAQLTLDGVSAQAVYKPIAGERPLWDFPDGTLAAREVAAYCLSEATGWGVVPPTVLRDGPAGPGMCQLWVDAEGEQGSLVRLSDAAAPTPPGWLRSVDLSELADRPLMLVHADHLVLRRLAVLDLFINNADRKAGHILPAAGGEVYGVDHGVAFHVDDKLRTVLWGWAGQPLPGECVAVAEAVCVDLAPGSTSRLRSQLCQLLTTEEIDATAARARRVVARPRYPHPKRRRWPPVPWPLF
jgi:uncharacterized repeat protein (TIGR03843 family)